MGLILKQNFCFDFNGRFGTTWVVTLYLCVFISSRPQVLERHGYVTNKDGCQAVINSLGKDIVNQKQYRYIDIFRLVVLSFINLAFTQLTFNIGLIGAAGCWPNRQIDHISGDFLLCFQCKMCNYTRLRIYGPHWNQLKVDYIAEIDLNLTLYPTTLLMRGKLGPFKNWPNTRKVHLSEDHFRRP